MVDRPDGDENSRRAWSGRRINYSRVPAPGRRGTRRRPPRPRAASNRPSTPPRRSPRRRSGCPPRGAGPVARAPRPHGSHPKVPADRGRKTLVSPLGSSPFRAGTSGSGRPGRAAGAPVLIGPDRGASRGRTVGADGSPQVPRTSGGPSHQPAARSGVLDPPPRCGGPRGCRPGTGGPGNLVVETGGFGPRLGGQVVPTPLRRIPPLPRRGIHVPPLSGPRGWRGRAGL